MDKLQKHYHHHQQQQPDSTSKCSDLFELPASAMLTGRAAGQAAVLHVVCRTLTWGTGEINATSDMPVCSAAKPRVTCLGLYGMRREEYQRKKMSPVELLASKTFTGARAHAFACIPLKERETEKSMFTCLVLC